jgi:hypothetical protein
VKDSNRMILGRERPSLAAAKESEMMLRTRARATDIVLVGCMMLSQTILEGRQRRERHGDLLGMQCADSEDGIDKKSADKLAWTSCR